MELLLASNTLFPTRITCYNLKTHFTHRPFRQLHIVLVLLRVDMLVHRTDRVQFVVRQ